MFTLAPRGSAFGNWELHWLAVDCGRTGYSDVTRLGKGCRQPIQNRRIHWQRVEVAGHFTTAICRGASLRFTLGTITRWLESKCRVRSFPSAVGHQVGSRMVC
jgi:hypothetical protein